MDFMMGFLVRRLDGHVPRSVALLPTKFRKHPRPSGEHYHHHLLHQPDPT
jgi:hypothetical protein